MTLSDYYSNKTKHISSLNVYFSQLQKGIATRLRNGPTQKQCEKLQSFLQDAWYGKGINQQSDYINKLIAKTYEQQTQQKLANFRLGEKTSVSTEMQDVKHIARERYETTRHPSHIYAQTLRNRINRIEETLTRIAEYKNTDNLQQLDIVEADLKELKKDILSLLKQYAPDEKINTKLDLQSDANLFTRVREIDQLYEDYLSPYINIFKSSDYGVVLEWALNAFNYDLNTNIEEMSAEIIKQITEVQGTQTTGQKDSAIQLTTSVQDVRKMLNKKANKRKTEKITLGGLEITYNTNIYSDTGRQGKMDVHLTLPKNVTNRSLKRPFRISAKNWGSTNRDFGSTSIANALLRSTNYDATSTYVNILQDTDPNMQQALNRAHQLAKLSIIADIIMGYSQKNQYADTLVINLRGSKPKVVVYSLKQLFQNLQNKLQNISILGYDDSQLQNQLQRIREDLLSQQAEAFNTGAYADIAINYLTSIHTTILYQSLVSMSKI